MSSEWAPPTIEHQCSACGYQYADRNDRIVHGVQVHGDSVRYLCHFGSCGAQYKSIQSALRHRAQAHGISGAHTQYIIGYASTDGRTCRQCAQPRLFRSRYAQAQHVRFHDDDDTSDEEADAAAAQHNATPDFIDPKREAAVRAPVYFYSSSAATVNDISVQ